METLAYVKVPDVYSAVGVDLKAKRSRYLDSYESNHILYHCMKCGTDFSVHHRYHNGYVGYCGVDDSTLFFCPSCGNQHKSFRGVENVYRSEDWTPTNFTLKVRELKNEIVLDVDAEIWMVSAEQDFRTTRHEQFRFNVKKRKTTFTRWDGKGQGDKEVMEIGAPFSKVIYTSMLWHLRSDNLSKKYKPEILRVTKTLREAIKKKWKAFHGYKLTGAYVSYGQQNGYMCFPLLNLAYKLVFPDCKGLPLWLNGSAVERTTESHRRYYDEELSGKGVFNDLDAFRKAENSLDPVIQYYSLPDTRVIRRVLTEDVYKAAILGRIHKLTQDQSHTLAIHDALLTLVDIWESGYTYTTLRRLTDRVLGVCEGRSGAEVRGFIRYIQKHGDLHLRDIENMLGTVPKSVREASRGVKLKDLHDWLVNEKRKIEEKGYALDVPEHVVKRLQMQMDSVKFYIPGHSSELVHGSAVFQNCVRTYSSRVLGGQCYIAFMTDENGRLTACLEVKGNELVQAKLKYNKPVHLNSAVNGAIVDWCKKTGLKIKTGDVREMRYPVLRGIAV